MEVHIVTAWNEDTNDDKVEVFADKFEAQKAYDKVKDVKGMYAGLYTRTIKGYVEPDFGPYG